MKPTDFPKEDVQDFIKWLTEYKDAKMVMYGSILTLPEHTEEQFLLRFFAMNETGTGHAKREGEFKDKPLYSFWVPIGKDCKVVKI
jgi:hypothetical protein